MRPFPWVFVWIGELPTATWISQDKALQFHQGKFMAVKE
ncbi:hypothetical protein EV13_0929 [Prochlorococcus sp. MIT 0702]|nr:hypothetical protein EV12_0451 [Prochlorococcus sp. MIT 0701]KGG29711.1 hypothetical protein EV13_0929 [Prochlorococcus sp. MIT 0702]